MTFTSKMNSSCTNEEFLLWVDVGHDNGVENEIGNVSVDVLKTAYRRTMNNVKNSEQNPNQRGKSPYRSMLQIILDEMNNRGIPPTVSSGKRSR